MTSSSLPTLPCLCGSLRRASRALTQLYDEALRPYGVRPSQMTILQALARTGEVSQGQLGDILAMDSTTLTRTLAIMRREGWTAERRGKDRRERWLRLSKAGEVQLARVLPAWERVQGRLKKELGQQRWDDVMGLTYQIATLTTKGDML